MIKWWLLISYINSWEIRGIGDIDIIKILKILNNYPQSKEK